METNIIDLWDVETFDEELAALLDQNYELIADHIRTDILHDRERAAATGWVPQKPNPYSGAWNYFVESSLMPLMSQRTIRAWHYTRLTKDEIARLRSDGIRLSNIETIRSRLDAQIRTGVLSHADADILYQGSPFHEQNAIRSGKFWLVSHPLPIKDSGVKPLLEKWGGEAISFNLDDGPLASRIKTIGQPCVIEVAVPLHLTRHAYSAAKGVVAAFERVHGHNSNSESFDLYIETALTSAAIIAIHTESDLGFINLANGYPERFPVLST